MWSREPLERYFGNYPQHRAWMCEPHKLYDALMRVSQQQPTVKRLFEGAAGLHESEQQRLSAQQGYVREVLMSVGDTPCYLARTVIADTTYRRFKTVFEGLGDAPLGDTLLYANPKTTWGAFEYALIDNPQQYFVCGDLDTDATHLGARRRLFYFDGELDCPLLITEVFLPHIPQYQPKLRVALP